MQVSHGGKGTVYSPECRLVETLREFCTRRHPLLAAIRGANSVTGFRCAERPPGNAAVGPEVRVRGRSRLCARARVRQVLLVVRDHQVALSAAILGLDPRCPARSSRLAA